MTWSIYLPTDDLFDSLSGAVTCELDYKAMAGTGVPDSFPV